MNKKSLTPGGFTLVELMITTAVMAIVALAIGVVIVDNQRGWSNMYGRMHSDVVTDGYVVRKKFDALMRDASDEKFVLGEDGSSVEAYFYSSSGASVPDRYIRFFAADGDLNIEYGQLYPRITSNVETVCGNVSECVFRQIGTSIQMILTLDDGTQTNTIVTSAVAHN
jgi:prepilin-type N-terminal cleavage/methylation domain-containing protein